MALQDAPVFDPAKLPQLADPLPPLRRLQEEDPVAWSPRYRAWIVTRYEDVRVGLNDQRLTPERAMPDADAFAADFRPVFADYRRYLDPWMVLRDPPDHTRLRGLANRAFTSRVIEGLRPRVVELVDELIAAMPAEGEVEFVSSFAYPLPAAVIAELIGVPVEIIDDLKRWSDGLASGTATNEDIYHRAAHATSEMAAYMRDFIVERRRKPGTAIIDGLIAARDGQDRLNDEELVSNIILLLFAGHETTTNLLSNGLRTLLSNPDQLADLRANLDDATLLKNTIEEMLRYDGSLFMVPRVAKQAFDWHGKQIAAGDRVFLYNLVANRDPRMFANAERFDIRRADASRHIAFGYGIHFCLGAPLSRLEMDVALPALLKRYAKIELLDAEMAWKPNLLLRGPREMRVRVSAH
jgi:cytochrome P450